VLDLYMASKRGELVGHLRNIPWTVSYRHSGRVRNRKLKWTFPTRASAVTPVFAVRFQATVMTSPGYADMPGLAEIVYGTGHEDRIYEPTGANALEDFLNCDGSPESIAVLANQYGPLSVSMQEGQMTKGMEKMRRAASWREVDPLDPEILEPSTDKYELVHQWQKEIEILRWYFHFASCLKECEKSGLDLGGTIVGTPTAPFRHLVEGKSTLWANTKTPNLIPWDPYLVDEPLEFDQSKSEYKKYSYRGEIEALVRKSRGEPFGEIAYQIRDEKLSPEVLEDREQNKFRKLLWGRIVAEVERRIGPLSVSLKLDHATLQPALEINTRELGGLGRAWFDFYTLLGTLETTTKCCHPKCEELARPGTHHCGTDRCRSWWQDNRQRLGLKGKNPVGRPRLRS
jgi:hypothetical protein